MKFKIEDIDENEIIAYLKGDVEALSPKTQEQFDRIYDADRFFYQHGNRNMVVKMLMKKYNYGRTQAFQDIQHAQHFFGKHTKHSKEYYRKFLVDKLSAAFVKCLKDEQFKAAASLAKEIRLSLGLHLEDSELPDWSQLEIPRTVIGFFPQLTNVQLPETPQLKLMLNDMLKDFKGIDMEEIFKNIDPVEFTEENNDAIK